VVDAARPKLGVWSRQQTSGTRREPIRGDSISEHRRTCHEQQSLPELLFVQKEPITTLKLGPESVGSVFYSTQFGGIHVVSVE